MSFKKKKVTFKLFFFKKKLYESLKSAKVKRKERKP